MAREHVRQRDAHRPADAHHLGLADCREPSLHRTLAPHRHRRPVRPSPARCCPSHPDRGHAQADSVGSDGIRPERHHRSLVPADRARSVRLQPRLPVQDAVRARRRMQRPCVLPDVVSPSDGCPRQGHRRHLAVALDRGHRGRAAADVLPSVSLRAVRAWLSRDVYSRLRGQVRQRPASRSPRARVETGERRRRRVRA